jgi:dTMP kinase
MSAKVIEFEGIDGSGKTTAYSYFIGRLRDKGLKVLDTREVGNPHLPVCVELRKLVLNPTSKLDGISMEFIFAAMRIENQKFYETVKNDYDYIVSDRGLLSHLAYTDHNVNAYFTEDFYRGVVMPLTRNPDLVLFLEIDPETALKRRNARNGFVDVIEAKGPEFQRKVYSSFMKYIRKLESSEYLRSIFIDANGTIEEVQKKLDFVIETSLS